MALSSSDYLSLNQISKRLGVNPNTLAECLRRGLFPNAYKQDRVHRVPEADVIAAEQILNETRDHISRTAISKELGIAINTLNSFIERGEIETKQNILGETVISRSQLPLLMERLGMTKDITGWIPRTKAKEIIQKGTRTTIIMETLTKLSTVRSIVCRKQRW